MKFGLIGHPIAHSLSPALFKAGYDSRYPYQLIEGADFEDSYRRFLEGYDGINVTAPFKEPAFAKADILSPECEAIGATNLLVKTPDGIKAYNSDYLGVRMWLSDVAEGLKSVLPPWPQGEGPTTKEWEGLFCKPPAPPETFRKYLYAAIMATTDAPSSLLPSPATISDASVCLPMRSLIVSATFL